MSPGKPRQFLFAAIAAGGFFLALEAGLRAAHFHYQRNLSYMEFGYPGKIELHQVFESDHKLLFRMKPGYDFKLGFGPLNQQGFRGKNFKKTKPANAARIACLGDSVTFGTAEGAFPEMMEQILLRDAGKVFQVYNFGVPGYSSWQGKNLLPRVLDEYHPEIVLIFYGWNDMWLAKGFSDQEQKPAEANAPLFFLRGELSRLRTYQLLNRIFASAKLKLSAGKQEKLRVPLNEFESNLEQMIEMTRASGAEPVLAAAPAGFGLAAMPDFFEYLGFARDADQIAGLRNDYNQAVAASAARSRTALIDLDLIFRQRGVKNFFDRPDKDVIHPNAAGLELIAESAARIIIDSSVAHEPRRGK